MTPPGDRSPPAGPQNPPGRPEPPDFDTVDGILREAARTIVLPHFQNLAGADVKTKTGPNDFVTVADERCEAFLREALTGALPGSTTIGEEAAAADPSVMERLGRPGDVWIIDPIDGTWNYAHDNPRFATIVALVRDGVTVRGYIHLPVREETYAAGLGQGAHGSSGALRMPAPAAFGAMTGALYVGKSRAPAMFERIKALRNRGRLGPRRFARCAAWEYIAMLTGRAHYTVFTRLLPWDHAAGILMIAEAGGCYGYVDGSPHSGPWRPVERDIPFLLAPDAASWRNIRDTLTED
ncbi:MAG: inositol monophosphatase [Rhodospirillaceae bacterium]|nr:inositol monophosphatase [Rhodospirillaceae bacterium]